MRELRQSIAASLREAIGKRRVLVFLPRGADAPHWESLLHEAGVDDVLLVELDDDKLLSTIGAHQPVSGVTSHLQLQHAIIDELTSSTPIDPVVQQFDPKHQAVVLAPDPLDLTSTGGREVLGPKSAAARVVEYKTIIDSLWELACIDRAEAVVCDLSPRVPAVIRALGSPPGVVLSCEHRGTGPHAGGESMWWSLDGKLPSSFPSLDRPGIRLRIMPLLHGLPCRIHGMTSNGETAVFPPLELVSLPRPASGTFFWAGAVPARTLTPAVRAHLHALTISIGTWLTAFGHSGAFAVDGIWTSQGYRPTELTPRLTSAFEGAEPMQRVLLDAANLIARSGRRPAELSSLARLAEKALADRIDIYGASSTASASGRYALEWTPAGPRIDGTVPVRGFLGLGRSPRGWSLHARLQPDELSPDDPVGVLAPQVFKLSDEIFGTGFGELAPPFGLVPGLVPQPRIPTCLEEAAKHLAAGRPRSPLLCPPDHGHDRPG